MTAIKFEEEIELRICLPIPSCFWSNLINLISKAINMVFSIYYSERRPPNIGIKHGFSYIYVCQIPREVLKTEAEGRGFQQLSRDLATFMFWKTMLENNVDRCYCIISTKCSVTLAKNVALYFVNA